MMKEYNFERTPWEKACKWLFRVINDSIVRSWDAEESE